MCKFRGLIVVFSFHVVFVSESLALNDNFKSPFSLNFRKSNAYNFLVYIRRSRLFFRWFVENTDFCVNKYCSELFSGKLYTSLWQYFLYFLLSVSILYHTHVIGSVKPKILKQLTAHVFYNAYWFHNCF